MSRIGELECQLQVCYFCHFFPCFQMTLSSQHTTFEIDLFNNEIRPLQLLQDEIRKLGLLCELFCIFARDFLPLL